MKKSEQVKHIGCLNCSGKLSTRTTTKELIQNEPVWVRYRYCLVCGNSYRTEERFMYEVKKRASIKGRKEMEEERV